MSWADYHLDDPTFCTPEIVAEGLVRALFERARAFFIARDGSYGEYSPDYFPTFRNLIIPDTFTRSDRFYDTQFCRKFDAYLAWFAWAGINSSQCPVCNPLGPLGPCEKTCQYYPWYGRDDTCKGYQWNWLDKDGVPYTLRSLLDTIGDKDLIDTSTLNTNQPSLFVPWVHQRVKILKKLRHFGTGEVDCPRIVLKYKTSDWHSTIYDSPYSTAQEAVNSVPRKNKSDTLGWSWSFDCLTEMVDGVCVTVCLELPVSAAPGFDANVPDAFKPKNGYFVFNVADPFVGTFNLLSAETKVVKGLNVFELQEDGTFFSNWPTNVTLPANLPDYSFLGWDMQSQNVYYDFNSTFEFQDED